MPHIVKLFTTFFKLRKKNRYKCYWVATQEIISKTERSYTVIQNFELIF